MGQLLNVDRESVVIGGLGSDATCVAGAAENLSAVLPHRVIGVTNHEARRSMGALADFATGRNVIPYSGAATLVHTLVVREGSRPESINFVAPPDIISRFAVVHGFGRAALARTGAATGDESSASQLWRFVHEVGSHPKDHILLIHQARRFSQLAAAVSLQSYGVRSVNLIIPEGDEMFSPYELPPDHLPDDNVQGVRYVVVSGGHTRFSNDTAQVLLEAQASPFAVVDETVLGRDIPERIRTQPTVGSTLRSATHALHRAIVSGREPIGV